MKKASKGNFEVVKQDTPKAPTIMNRRQKQKVSDLIKLLRINYNKLMMKKKEISNEEKHALVDESIKHIADKYVELLYKHDGCRLLQALLKYGNKPQRELVTDKIKEHFIHLMTSKYSHYLASKLYYFAPREDQKAFLRSEVAGSMQKLIMHAYAAEVVEYIYCQSDDNQRIEMVIGLYGNYFLLLKDFINEENKKPNSAKLRLKTFLELKPNLTQGIMDKLENVVQRLVEKGMIRHSIVQAILLDYISCQPDKEKLKLLAEMMKEKLPALLASRPGLAVACGIFNVLDAKDRKLAIKALPVVEML